MTRPYCARTGGFPFALALALGLSAVSIAPWAQAQGASSSATASARPSSAPASPGLEAGLAALEKSDYVVAERELTAASKGAQKAPAFLGLARVALGTGKYPDAVRQAESAIRLGGQPALDAVEVKARALAAQGKVKEAIAAAESVKDKPDARRARLVLGELLIQSGRSADARDPLMSIIQDYNSEAIARTDGEGLALVGRAAHLLRSARDANDAFNESERAGKHRVETLLWRGELFLEKYDPGHAEEVVKEALSIAPNHADALVMLAKVKLDQALDFAAAEALIQKALSVNPKLPQAFVVRAGLALRDFDLVRTEAAIDEGLRINPADLQLLSMRAAARFLADDKPGFEAARKAVFAVNPEYSTLYQIVGEYAEWEHRYTDIVQMMQQAVQVDSRDAKAWAVLGLNQIRLGDEQNGVDALRKAWRFDKFNVRVYNTLNLFEKDIATQYETVSRGHFRYRFDKAERAMLERYMPPMLEEAFDAMSKHYGFTPTTPVGIELYSSSEQFSIRTSGLPHVGIQGVCFGTTLAANSPKGEAFNWGNVLWHELGHVFAIQLSKAHVPRWFTEGLSEYETFIRRPEWQREEDEALFTALKGSRIPEVAHFNRAFTHVDDLGDVTMAYYAASQIVTYIGQHYGMPKIAQMLRLWGEGKRDGEVVQQALGIDMTELDKQFRQWLSPRFQRYQQQFVPDLRAPSLEVAEKAAKAEPNNAQKQLQYALASFEEGKAEQGLGALDSAKRLAPNDALVRFVSVQVMLKKKQFDKAQAALEQMVREKQDGYAVRMRLADLAEVQKDYSRMRAHLEAARRWDPSQVEALQALYDLAKKQNRTADMISALRELSVLDQHERRAYSRLMELLGKAGMWEELRQVGARAVFVDIYSPRVHTLYGQALAKAGQKEQALFELDSALMCEPEKDELIAIRLERAQLFKAMGQGEKAKAEATEVLKLEPNNAEARGLLK